MKMQITQITHVETKEGVTFNVKTKKGEQYQIYCTHDSAQLPSLLMTALGCQFTSLAFYVYKDGDIVLGDVPKQLKTGENRDRIISYIKKNIKEFRRIATISAGTSLEKY